MAHSQSKKRERQIKDSLAGYKDSSALPIAIPRKLYVPNDFIDLLLTERDSQNREYIEPYELQWSPRAALERRSISFGFKPSRYPVGNSHYYPNTVTSISLGMFWTSLGASLSFTLPVLNQKERNRNLGKTSYYDILFNSYREKFGVDLFIYRYKGFFLAEPGQVFPESDVIKAYPQRPDINYLSIGGTYYSVTNWRKFSLQAPFLMVKKQKKSAGSTIWMVGLNYNRIKAHSAIEQFDYENDKPSRKFTRGQFTGLSIMPGYGHTLVYQNWFVSAMLFAGPALQMQVYEASKTNEVKLSPAVRINFRASAGYSGNKYFAGLQVYTDFTRNFIEGTRMSSRYDAVRVLGGFRF